MPLFVVVVVDDPSLSFKLFEWTSPAAKSPLPLLLPLADDDVMCRSKLAFLNICFFLFFLTMSLLVLDVDGILLVVVLDDADADDDGGGAAGGGGGG